MKLKLPNGEKIELNEKLSIKEKLKIVNDLVDEWDEQIHESWFNTKIKYFLDGLANYLVWHKDEHERNTVDKYVLSVVKVEELSGKRKGKSIPFSSMTDMQMVLFDSGEGRDENE